MTRIIAETHTLPVSRMIILLMCIPLRFAAADAFLVEDARELSALNVSIAVFDTGVPEDLSLHRDLQVFPQIREIEAMFLPFVLRDTLVRTNEWVQ